MQVNERNDNGYITLNNINFVKTELQQKLDKIINQFTKIKAEDKYAGINANLDIVQTQKGWIFGKTITKVDYSETQKTLQELKKHVVRNENYDSILSQFTHEAIEVYNEHCPSYCTIDELEVYEEPKRTIIPKEYRDAIEKSASSHYLDEVQKTTLYDLVQKGFGLNEIYTQMNTYAEPNLIKALIALHKESSKTASESTTHNKTVTKSEEFSTGTHNTSVKGKNESTTKILGNMRQYTFGALGASACTACCYIAAKKS